jgi:isopenicillin N synthase-like dioxygenase
MRRIPSQQLPLLDLGLYYTNRQAFVEELRHACHTVGFFLLRHDNDAFGSLADKMLDESRQFFARPLAQKMEVSYADSPSFRGYMPLGVENTGGKLDAREQIEYAVEYPREGKKWPLFERLKSTSNPWPNKFQPSLETTTTEFSKEVCHVADCIRDALCLALGLDPAKVLHQSFAPSDADNELPHWVMKMISYPSCEGKNKQQQQQGVGAHTDTNFLTLVLQDQVGGLQAFSQGEWIDVPTNNEGNGDGNNNIVLVCNLGEQAEIWSRGYFLATPHRVLSNTSTQMRTSVPLFYNPILSATMEPSLEESSVSELSWDRPQDYDHWRRKNNTMLSSVGENTFKSLARSHPDVFQRHHPDLVVLEDGRIVRKDEQL